MVITTYIKDKKKSIRTQYHLVKRQLESSYDLIHSQIFSKFHSSSSNKSRELITRKVLLCDLIEKAASPYIEKKIFTKISPFSSPLQNNDEINPYSDLLDWKRSRFVGEIEKIKINSGQIIEKVFVTPKGSRIIVRRSELGIFLKMPKNLRSFLKHFFD